MNDNARMVLGLCLIVSGLTLLIHETNWETALAVFFLLWANNLDRSAS